MLRALVFDVDGTLAETEEAHRQAFNETFPEFGLDWNWDRDRYRHLLKTTGGKERMRRHAAEIGLNADDLSIAEIHARKTARYGELIEDGSVPLRPGIESLLQDARSKGIRLAVATTTNLPNVERLIKGTLGCSASDIFEVIAAGDMVKSKKPAPDVFELAVKNLSLSPGDCLAFEDSRNGLLSARQAGLPCLVCPSWYTSRHDFQEATALVNSYEEVRNIAALMAMFEIA